MNATGKRRLLKLADFLETLPRKKKLDMGHFAETIENGRPACGTSACAAGWAAAIPSFQRAGYSLAFVRGMGFISPRFGKLHGWRALRAFFDIDYGQAAEIFSGLLSNSRKQAAQRIRRVVKQAA